MSLTATVGQSSTYLFCWQKRILWKEEKWLEMGTQHVLQWIWITCRKMKLVTQRKGLLFCSQTYHQNNFFKLWEKADCDLDTNVFLEAPLSSPKTKHYLHKTVCYISVINKHVLILPSVQKLYLQAVMQGLGKNRRQGLWWKVEPFFKRKAEYWFLINMPSREVHGTTK